MPTPFNRGKFGRKSPVAPRRECEVCGVPMARTNYEEPNVCLACSGRPKQKPRLPDKSEVVDRDDDETDEEREEFRDAFLDYYGRDGD